MMSDLDSMKKKNINRLFNIRGLSLPENCKNQTITSKPGPKEDIDIFEGVVIGPHEK